MFFHDDFCAGLMRAVKFNRFISLLISLNLMLNSSISSWATLLLYIFFTEIIMSILRNRALVSKKVCANLFNVNIILTSLFLMTLAFTCANKDYIFLSIIPIFQAALYRKYAYIAVVVGAMSAFIFALTFSLTKLFSFVTVIGLLSFLGVMLSKILTRTNTKADYLHSMATTDGLTGLINRREFDRRISEEFSRSKRHKLPVSLALFDIDYFKKINDTYGHATGDVILKELGELISYNTRNFDIVARYGGEEFALILPQTLQVEAFELMDRLRQKVEKALFNKEKCAIKLTISIGVAQLDLIDATPLDLIERTDKALYKAKESGRNRVERAVFGGLHLVTPKKKAV